MDWSGAAFAAIQLLMREAALFAALGFLVLGIGDLIIDFIWIGQESRRRLFERAPEATAASLTPPSDPGAIAVFVPAWDEGPIVAEMLRAALKTFDHPDYRIYVGCYPNDPATIAAVRGVGDSRIRLVIGAAPGPTTKADCLNRLWEAMLGDEEREGRRFKAIVLHDAEDVVHSAELRLFDRLIEDFDLVQLPVLPLIVPKSRWVAGHYADEFAEAHGKDLTVRESLGAGLPSAGVGCAFARGALAAVAARSGGLPFDADSLTEDYELGLRLRSLGARAAFVRIRAAPGRGLVVTKECFPATVEAAVNQKARWIAGIALSGWDRLGWSGGLAERWMRLRDRQSVLSALLLLCGYVAAALWLLAGFAGEVAELEPEPLPPLLQTLVTVNLALLGWRAAMRFAFVTSAYGWAEGIRSIPRMVVANLIAILAARRAVLRYLSARRSGSVKWHKTVHDFPLELPAE